MHTIRQMTGVCPQHDILFDLLTPREHLEFFAAVRVSLSPHQKQFSHKQKGSVKDQIYFLTYIFILDSFHMCDSTYRKHQI
jgi:hypothetical protein